MKQIILIFTLCFIGLGTKAQKNQHEELSNLSSGKFSIFKPDGDKIVASGKPWPVEIVKSGSKVEKIVLQRAGIIEEEFKPDLANHPAYFLFESQRLATLENAIFYFTWKGVQANIKYVLTPEGKNFSGSVKDWEQKLAKYQLAVLAGQGGARENLAEEKKEQEKANKIANSISNKKVKSIKASWISLPSKIGHGSKLKYGIEATLEDGSVLKTNTLGGKMPWDDFTITVEGAEFGEEQVAVEMDAKKIPNDKVIVHIKAKSNASLSTKIETNVNYLENVNLEYNAYQNGGYVVRNTGAHGSSAFDITVKSSSYVTKNGDNANKVEVIETSTGKVLNRLKMSSQATLNIYSNGDSGMSGKDSKRGGNGGNGGNFSVVKGAGSSLQLNIINNGGRGGTHSSALMNGNDGRKGNISNLNQAVSFSW